MELMMAAGPGKICACFSANLISASVCNCQEQRATSRKGALAHGTVMGTESGGTAPNGRPLHEALLSDLVQQDFLKHSPLE